MTLHPASNGGFAEIAAGLPTLDPLVTQGLLFPFSVHAGHFHCSAPLPRTVATRHLARTRTRTSRTRHFILPPTRHSCKRANRPRRTFRDRIPSVRAPARAIAVP